MKTKSNSKTKTTSDCQTVCVYDDGNIPDVELPGGEDAAKPVDPLSESKRPRKSTKSLLRT